MIITLFILSLFIFGFWLPMNMANAAPDVQSQFATATPGPDGRILYIVQEGDTCTRVASLHGISVEQLRALNIKLDADCALITGQPLIVGIVNLAGSAPTVVFTPTSSIPTPTSTPFTGTTEICVLLFDDVNGDAIRQTTEPSIEGGAVSVTNLNGSYSQTKTTASALDPNTGDIQRACFSDVPEGQYNVSVAVPDNYNATMAVSATVTVQAGDRASIDFGAQSKAVTASQPTPEDTPGTSPLLGFFGLLLLLAGGGLGWYAWRMRQPQSKLKGSPLTKR